MQNQPAEHGADMRWKASAQVDVVAIPTSNHDTAITNLRVQT